MTGNVPPDIASQLAAMQAAPIMPDGWDVALHLSQNAVQSLINADWAGPKRLDAARSVNWIAPAEEGGQHVVIDLRTSLAPPQVQLDADTQSAILAFDIDRGVLRVGKVAAGKLSSTRDLSTLDEGGDVQWDDIIDITARTAMRLQGQAPVALKTNDQDDGLVISLEFDATTLTLSSEPIAQISGLFGPKELTPWLTSQGLTGQIAVVAKPSGHLVHALSPVKVAARVVAGDCGAPVLQMLTAATTRAGIEDMAVPVPQSDSFDFSLVVSSKAAATMIANSYNEGTGEIKLNTEPPQDGLPHWFTQVREPMVFQGAFGIDGGETLHTDHSEMFMRFGGSVDDGVTLSTYIDPASTVHLELDLAAHFPLGISGKGTAQMVGLTDGAQSVTGDGFYEQLVVPQLTSFLTGDIRDDMIRVQLSPLSQLALQDLKLSGLSLAFKLAAMPGELVIMGNLDDGTE